HFRNRTRAKPWALVLLLVVLAASQFATPMGWGILAVSRANMEAARDWLGVSEWLPPWDRAVAGAAMAVWLALGVSLAVLLRLKCRVEPRELCLFLVMTLLALSASRLILFWGVAMVPAWARWIERAKPPALFAWRADGPMNLRVAA